MEDESPHEDFQSRTAAKMMDIAFGLNGMARWIAGEARREESLERDRRRKQAAYNREQERLRKQRQRENARILAQAQSAVPAANEDDAA